MSFDIKGIDMRKKMPSKDQPLAMNIIHTMD
jgi:hypothetical protein